MWENFKGGNMISAEFIEMSRDLPKEVQDLIPETIETRWCDGEWLYMGEIDSPDLIMLGEVNLTNDFVEPFKVPRQEDLQEIYKQVQDCNFEFMLLRFREYIDKGIWDYGTGDGQWVCFNNQWHITDFTTLWLCFVMEMCYGKRWDTEKKTWTVI
jgi:hypothetical protein